MLKYYTDLKEPFIGMQAEYTCVKHSEYSICTKRRMQNEEERNAICDIKTEAREKCWQLTAVHA